MNYLSGALRYVAGGESDQRDAIPRLIDRIKTSALPQDRRTAVATLAEATKRSPQQQILVGELGIKLIYAVLEQDKDYDDTLKATLDLLIAICGTLDPPGSKDLSTVLGDAARGMTEQEMLNFFKDKTARAASTNTDMFLGMPNSVSLILELLEKTDFYVKFSAIELLTAMAANSRNTLQMAVLEAPQGVSRICDLLDDSHRLLRSNAVLLLSTLCDESTEICKIVAYGGVLEKLFSLIESVSNDTRGVEGYEEDDDDDDALEAAIVVQDVLLVVRNLVRGASTTKTFIRDTGCLPRLVNAVKRAAVDSNMQKGTISSAKTGADAVVTGRKIAVEKQARKNLIVAMQCLSGLVKDGDNESRLVKNDLTTTNIFNLLANLAFSSKLIPDVATGKLPENGLHVRVAALKSLAMLARGHDEFRSMFSSATVSDSEENSSISGQVAAMQAMLGDPSSAIRAAAYCALRESFVVDAGLDLPSSNLLNVMTGSGGTAAYSIGNRSLSASRRVFSSNNLSSANNSIQFIAESLKAAVVGWPSSADPAGVFYASSLLIWLLARVQGARERMLTSYVNGSALLPQMIRLLGKAERENGPPEVRIGLFSLACAWLYESPSAVSTFLSSAMHLPMLVDVLKGSGSRGDVAEVHVRGLAAVVLAICLQAADGANDAASDTGFLSGRGGLSVVIPKGTISDVIRNRIGVTVFTACLDDLRACKSFSIESNDNSLWSFTENLILMEERSGPLSLSGNLGHERWYDSNLIGVVNGVYQVVGANALDLVSDHSIMPAGNGNGNPVNSQINGHHGGTYSDADTQRSLLADSTRDEVLNSYKEFIRSQDESLNAARRQIDELATALRETQLELDAKANEAATANQSRNTPGEYDNLLAQKEALEALIEEKNADFAALSEAYAALEEDHNDQVGVSPSDGPAHIEAELSELRSQKALMRDSLNSEVAKNSELAYRVTVLEGIVSAKDVELEAVSYERNQLQDGVQVDISQALSWKTQAEVAQSNLESSQSVLKALQVAKVGLESNLRDLESSRSEDQVRMRTLEKHISAAQSELSEMRSTRKRELQVARESAHAATSAAQADIAALKEQLIEAREQLNRAQGPQQASATEEQLKSCELLKNDHNSLLMSFEEMKTELLDSRNALNQWKRKAGAGEEAKEREEQEKNRLAKLSRDLGGKVQTLSEDLAKQTKISSSALLRVSELEQQSAELDELRRLAGEESQALKEELATRTEQTIRLSGQLYEAEEGKAKTEEEFQILSKRLAVETAELNTSGDGVFPSAQVNYDSHAVAEVQKKLAALEEELEITKDALTDAKDRESLSQAQAMDREDIVTKAFTLEKSLSEAESRESQLIADINELKERLLSLDEAENSKRALTMQVIDLQKSLAVAAGGTTEIPGTNASVEVESTVRHLENLIAEKDMRLSQLESSLTAAMDETDVVRREKLDFEKQITETEATLSVLQKQREEFSERCEQLNEQLEERPQFSEMDTAVLEQMRSTVEESERKRSAVSNELSSLVDACRLSEQEMRSLRDENEGLRRKISNVEKEFESLTAHCEDLLLAQEVERVVSCLCTDAVVCAASEANTELLEVVRNERDTALFWHSEEQIKLDAMRTEVMGLQVALKDHDAFVAEASAQKEEVSHLNTQLSEMQSIVEERDQLVKSLEDASASLKALTKEKEAITRSINEERSRQLQIPDETSKDTKEGSTTAFASSSTTSRVSELEGALRDAARTVSATNLELISAQSLLVELSSDKTTIRTELAAALEEIKRLNAQRSIQGDFHPKSSAISEILEQEQSTSGHDPSPDMAEGMKETTERSLTAAHAEIENLQTIMQRSVSEAESACSILKTINAKVQHMEDRVKVAQLSLLESKAAEVMLSAELQTLRESFGSEKDLLLSEIRAYKSQVSEARKVADSQSIVLNKQLADLEQTRNVERETLQACLLDKERHIEEISGEYASLKSKFHEVSQNATRVSERVHVLESANSKYITDIAALQATVAKVNNSLSSNESLQRQLKSSLQLSQDELRNKEEHFLIERNCLESRLKKEAEEFEAEIDRSNDALEEAERQFRNSEAALKRKITSFEDTRKSLENSIHLSKRELQSVKTKLAATVEEKVILEVDMSEKLKRFEMAASLLKEERDDALASVNRLTQERDVGVERLATFKAALEKCEADLKEEIEQKTMLEGENVEFAGTIESLEAISKRFQSELASKKRELVKVNTKAEQSERLVDQQVAQLKNLQEELSEKESNLNQVYAARSKLEDEGHELRTTLSKTMKAKESLEQDNGDLKAWVGDLERQATELQSAAENFEEVEMNLREALEAQRDVAEQNMALAEDVKREREATTAAEAQARSALREKSAAEAARDSSQRRANELEERIREIREEHLVKFSNSEDSIRSRSQRCAKLETELATAERKLAELASVSDSLFAVKAELSQRDDDIANLQKRAEAAEILAEELEVKLQSSEMVMSQMRESGTGDAYRMLEAEHNELLVCLAELELECTILKEELGRE